jgi:predicted RNA-binding protein with PUA-like domain
MNWWVVKSEPDVFSIDDLENSTNKTTFWDGVRNYQARNFLRDSMKIGDKVLFYHSSTDPMGVAGWCEVVREGYPDSSAFDPQSHYFDASSTPDNPVWIMVDIKLVEKFSRLVTLQEIKENPNLKDMTLIKRGNRLSVFPVKEEEFNEVLRLAGQQP